MRYKRILLTVALAVTGFAGSSAPAMASGVSPLTNGCYAQWGSTGTSGYCYPATVTGRYRVDVDCSGPDSNVTSSWVAIGAGSSIYGFGQVYCTWGVSSARIEFTGL
jgi:hypothetical protein